MSRTFPTIFWLMLYEPLLKSQLNRVAKAYLSGSDLSPSTIARRFADDSRFFIRVLEQGCSFTVVQYDRVICRFSLNWPEGVEWPAEVPRPSPQQAGAVMSRLARSRAA